MNYPEWINEIFSSPRDKTIIQTLNHTRIIDLLTKRICDMINNNKIVNYINEMVYEGYMSNTRMMDIVITLCETKQYKLIFGKFLPVSLKEIIIFIIMAFVVGWIIDVIIMKADIFGPSLRPFYEKYGAGFWGAASFVFALFITIGFTFILKKFVNN